MLCVGWDVSTVNIGICAIDLSTNIAVKFKWLPIDGESMIEKYSCAVGQIEQVLLSFNDEYGPERAHFVEDRLGNFSVGATTMQTLMKLAQMNAVVSHRLSSDGPIRHLHPATAKRLAGLKVPKGGDKKLEAIRLAISNGGMVVNLTKKGNYSRGTDDMADAFLLAVAGTKLLTGEAELDGEREARGAEESAGTRIASR